jgi:hypothetical protein
VPELQPKPSDPKCAFKDLGKKRREDAESSGESTEYEETPTTDRTNATPQPITDNVHANIVLLTRDLLYVIELINAMSTGDFGWIEYILLSLAYILWGAGSNNYSMEILHLIFNFKKVWTPEFG